LVSHPYTIEDARNCLGRRGRRSGVAQDFFDRYIRGREVVDYRALLERRVAAAEEESWARVDRPLQLSFDFGGARVSLPTLQDTPVHAAGLDRGDEVLALDGKRWSPMRRWPRLFGTTCLATAFRCESGETVSSRS
jgi:predicted metalloprotease with PDZ domain